ncbi:MAG: hypothetical protein AAGA48_01920 [Myxococcota bacterium]
MWLVTALVAQAHVPATNVIETVDQRTLATRPNAPWAVEPVGDDGLVIYTEDRGVMVARHYDNDLSLQWSVPLPEIVTDAPLRTLYRDDAAWAVFQRRALALVTRHNVRDGTYQAWFVPLKHRSRRVVDFEMVGKDAWLVMVDGRSDQGGGLRHLDLKSGVSKAVSLPRTPETIELQRLTADPDRGVVDVSYRTALEGRYTQHVAVAKAGRLTNDIVLQVPDLNLLDIQRHVLDEGHQLAVGTYADEATGTRAQGFYAARFDPSGHLTYVATHSFSSLGHFFDDLPPERRNQKRKQVAERQRRGSDVDIDVRFATHDAQLHDGRIVVSGEIFVPRLGTVPRVVMVDVDGGVRAQTLDVGDGYWFTHAIVAAIDPDGSVAWDASLPMRNVGGSRIEPHVKVGLDGDVATLAYASGERLVSRVFHRGILVEDRAETELVPYDRTLVRSQSMTVEPWFDNQWVSYGAQRLRNGGARQFVIERLVAAPELPATPPQATLTPLKPTN